MLSAVILSVTAAAAEPYTRGEGGEVIGDTLRVTDSIIADKRGVFKKFIDYFADANKDNNKKFDISFIGGPHYSSDVKFGLGLAATGLYKMDRRDTLLPHSNVSLYGDVTTAGFYLVGIQGHNLFPRNKYRLNYDLYFSSFLNYYWGSGYEMTSDNDNRSRYKEIEVQAKIDFMFLVAPKFYIGPLLNVNYFYASNPQRPALWKGQDLRTTSIGAGFSVLYDSRDNLTNAFRGYYLRIDQTFNPSFLDNKYDFYTTELTTSYYHPVWKGGVVAAQFHAWLNFGDPPWGMMASLGSSYSMRGYYEGRYRDKCAMDMQLELRQHIWRRHGVVVWVGAGTIFPDFGSFETKHILPNYGFGYRWEFKKRVNVRLDMGFGKGQSGFIFNINEAF